MRLGTVKRKAQSARSGWLVSVIRSRSSESADGRSPAFANKPKLAWLAYAGTDCFKMRSTSPKWFHLTCG